jgi:hypothetical protein
MQRKQPAEDQEKASKRPQTLLSVQSLSAISLALLALFIALLAAARTVRASETDDDWTAIQNFLSKIKGVTTTPLKGVVDDRFTAGLLLGNGDLGVVAGDTTSQQKFYFGKNDFWGSAPDDAHPEFRPGVLSLGGLTIRSPKPSVDPDSVYRMEQDIVDAKVVTVMRLANTIVTMRSWTADADNVFITEFSSATGSEPVPITVELSVPPSKFYPYTSGVTGGTLWITRANNFSGPDDFIARAAIAVRLLGAQFLPPSRADGAATGRFTLEPGVPVRLVAVVRNDARTGPSGPSMDALRQNAVAAAEKLSAADIEAFWTGHLAFWKSYWLRSYIRIYDDVLEKYYYGALYVLGSSTRPDKFVQTPMFGPWVTTDTTKWGARYFDNYNVEAPYYGMFSANRPDWILPYTNYLFAEAPFQQNATARTGYKGVAYARSFPPFDQFAPRPAPVAVADIKDYTKFDSSADQKSDGSFFTIPAIWYWEYTRDDVYLRGRLYPQLKALDAFWRDFMVWDGDRYVVDHSSAHEGMPLDLNPNLDLGFIRKIDRTLIEASRELGVDFDMVPVWQNVLDHLSAFPTETVNGVEVFTIAEVVNNGQHRTFEPGGQPINMEGTVFPGENLSIGGDPRLLQIAMDTITQMNSWGVTTGSNSTNGFQKEFPIAARVGWPADDLFEKLRAAILYHWREPSLTVAHRSGGIETAGTIECINSMLLQHEDGVLRIFPDWPKDKDAMFKRLLAKGAFEVSSEMKAGAIPYVDITSEKGRALTIANPWPNRKPSIERVDAATSAAIAPVTYKMENGNLVFATKSGERYLVTLGKTNAAPGPR